MTTIIDQIRAEIKRLEGVDYPCDTSEQATGFYDALDRISRFLDTLQETAKRTYKDCMSCEHCIPRKDQIGWQFYGCFGGDYKGKYIAEIDVCPLKVAALQEQSCETCTNDKGCVTCKDGELWEGKEVDLEAEMEKEIKEHYYDDQDVYWWNYLKKSFRHFFILGIKATCNTPMKQITLNELATEGISDVEEAAEKYATEWHKNPDGSEWRPYFEVSAIKAFKAGAEWMKEKDTRDMYMSDNRHYEKVYELGKKDMKKKMLEDAVEGVMIDSLRVQIMAPLNAVIQREGLKDGDKMKILIVKEEEV